MICEVCGKDNAIVGNICNVYSATMCSSCRRMFHYFMTGTVEWKGIMLTTDAISIYTYNGETDKILEAKSLLEDMLRDICPLIQAWVQNAKNVLKENN